MHLAGLEVSTRLNEIVDTAGDYGVKKAPRRRGEGVATPQASTLRRDDPGNASGQRQIRSYWLGRGGTQLLVQQRCGVLVSALKVELPSPSLLGVC